MSRKYIVIIIVAAAIAAAAVGGNAWFNNHYNNVDAGNVPVTPILVAEQEVLPVSAELTIPVFGNAPERYMTILNMLRSALDDRLDKDLSCVPENGMWIAVQDGTDPVDTGGGSELGLLGEAPYSFEFELPDDMYWSVAVKHIDEKGTETPILAEGRAKPEIPMSLSETVMILKAGEYVLAVEGTLYQSGPETPSGTVIYRAYFSVKNPDPVFEPGRTELAQGDILSLRLENIPEGIVPELESELGPAVFTQGVPFEDQEHLKPEGFTNWYAAVPISNSRAEGDFPVSVRAGDLLYDTVVTVVSYEFDFQNMIIDMSVPSVASAVTGEAIAEFREKVIPLFSMFSEERYWEGLFAWPVDMGPEDFISTEFGEIRITNGDHSTRRSHLGVDIAASTGTPVLATGAGRVLLAEFLLNTGYTVVIDHGGGLKSIYYHMDSIDTVPGTVVERGELIGRVGTTGYSTGPHLHFEMRIGEQPINPSMLLDPNAGLYSAK